MEHFYGLSRLTLREKKEQIMVKAGESSAIGLRLVRDVTSA